METDIYLISMKRDKKRREALKKRFPLFFNTLKIVDAIDATLEKSESLINSFLSKGNTTGLSELTKGEQCCALSHVKALEMFLKTNKRWCMIIEDDLIGNDSDFERSLSLINDLESLSTGGLLILGGQQGLKNAPYLSGKRINKYLWWIPHYCRFFITRACCYAISRDLASKICSRQKNNLSRSDQWDDLCKKNEKIYYANLFIHPENLNESHIEIERDKHWTRKLSNDGITKTFIRNIFKLNILVLRRMGFLDKVEIK
jgi:glycosyl transferase family 25